MYFSFTCHCSALELAQNDFQSTHFWRIFNGAKLQKIRWNEGAILQYADIEATR